MKIKIFLLVFVVFLLPLAACQKASKSNDTKLLYQGHGSLRLIAKNGTVVYVDPYVGEGYNLPADIILVTHQHFDHNKIELVTQKKKCVVISNNEAIEDGKYKTFKIKGITIDPVEASNKNHDPSECVGYIITIDGIKVYVAGDTSKTAQMETFAAMNLDYALLPCDGVYNMDAKEATECAKIIGAKNNIPYHTSPEKLLDREIAENFDAPNRLIVEAGEEIKLVK